MVAVIHAAYCGSYPIGCFTPAVIFAGTRSPQHAATDADHATETSRDATSDASDKDERFGESHSDEPLVVLKK